ncbi:MAG TPA: superoxide dismutase family protein [Epulopiscium sp.]|nr:superoxide dismutase family protein [Candidatus Epulonipiscium sp.]
MYLQLTYPPFFNGYYYPYRNDVNIQPRKAVAYILGGSLAPQIKGVVTFSTVVGGTEVFVEVSGLPLYKSATEVSSQVGPHGFHIHENGACETDDPTKQFEAAGGHWNPTDEPHGNHAGDFPVIFSNNGYARMSFFTNKFTVPQIIGKSIIIHESPDDYKTQPSGASGRKLACGVIQKAI